MTDLTGGDRQQWSEQIKLCAAKKLLMLQSGDTHLEACTQTPTMTYKDEETQGHTYTQDSCTQTTKVTILCSMLCVHTIGCPTDEVVVVLVTHNKLPLNLQQSRSQLPKTGAAGATMIGLAPSQFRSVNIHIQCTEML